MNLCLFNNLVFHFTLNLNVSTVEWPPRLSRDERERAAGPRSVQGLPRHQPVRREVQDRPRHRRQGPCSIELNLILKWFKSGKKVFSFAKQHCKHKASAVIAIRHLLNCVPAASLGTPTSSGNRATRRTTGGPTTAAGVTTAPGRRMASASKTSGSTCRLATSAVM